MPYDKFERQKKHLRRCIGKNAALCALFIIFLIFDCLLLMSYIWMLLPMAFFLAVAILLVRDTATHIKLLGQIKRIEQNESANKTYDVSLYHPVVRFLCTMAIRTRHRADVIYFGIVLTDAHKNKYYYLYREGMKFDKGDVARLKEKFYREIHIQCYENTRVIKTIENDPYFANIKFGSYYD